MINLFEIAERDGIAVELFGCPKSKSFAIDRNIALDYDLFGREERSHLAHELGHCETGAFYNRYAAADIIEKHERRADRWAIIHTVPKDELALAVRRGVTEVWELAEYFGISEDLMRKAILYYQSKPA